MNRWLRIASFSLVFILASDISYAAGIIMRIQQMKAQKQRQAQGMTQEQYQQYLEYQEQQQGDQNQAPPWTKRWSRL